MSGRAGEAWITLIAGPTASGKSALALRLAEETGADIVNADSMQLYADLRVLTARPTEAEEARVPHNLYGVADGDDPWSVGRWLRAALPVLERLRSAGRPAIVVGGTGLYFRALTQGLAETPDVPEAARNEAATRLQSLGEPAFRDALARADPEAEARIAPGDRQRLIRAWGVWESTGRSLTAWQATTAAPFPAAAWRALVLEPARPQLYARCDARVAAMVEGGALEEVRALAARELDTARPVMKAVGVRAFAEHLAGRRTLEHAVETVRQETRNYAKRQLTWFRNQTPDWPRLDPFTLDSSGLPQ